MTEELDRRLVAVMFTDMLGYTTLIQADERVGQDRRDRYLSVVESQHGAFGGTIVQRLGDGTMSMFPSSLAAVRAAVAIQRELGPQQVPVRIGLHAGEVIVEPDRLTGLAVNIASRIESFAEPGGVMLSDSVYEQIANRSDIAVVELGRFKLKNVGRPFELYAVSADGLVVPDAAALEGKGERIVGFPSSLVGREAEHRRIDQLLQQAVAGSSGVLVLRGDPGIGKTTLLDYAASHAGPMRVLRATGIEAEKELGFAGLYSLLRPVADYLKGLPEPQAAALRCALGLGYDEGPPDRLAVAAGTHGLLTTVAEEDPLLILVDDLHWLDPASREALLFALRRLDRDAIACLLTLRPGTAVPAGLPCQEVTGLDSAAAKRLVEAVSGTTPVPEVTRRLYAETGGNPLALVELSAALTAGQLHGVEPPGAPLEPGAAIRQRFAARLDQLSPSARLALMVAAAAGRCSPAEVYAAAASLGTVDGDALGEAEAADLIRLTSTGVEFSHPLVRSVAYHLAVPAQRRAAHLALAETLADRDAERAAWHLAAAATGPDDQAAAALDAAADLAVAKGAPLAAAAAWERAAALSGAAAPEAARLAEAAEAALAGGDLDRATRLTQTLPAAGSLAHRARLLAVRGRLRLTNGHTAVAQHVLEEAAALCSEADPRLAIELLSESVTAGVEAGLFEEASQAAARMADLAEQSTGTARFLADLAYGGLAWRRGDAEQGMRLISRAVAAIKADPEMSTRSAYLLYVAAAWCGIGDLDRARQYADLAVELARSEGAVGRLPDALQWAAGMCKETGRWVQALAYGSQALDLAHTSGQTYLACNALVIVAEIEAAQGRDEDCLRHARDADRLGREADLRLLQVRARLSPALLDLGRGRLEEAITRYEELHRLTVAWGIGHPYYSALPDLIEAYARSGAADQARALLPEYLAQVPGDHPLPAARAARCQGIVATSDFDRHFQEAISLHERNGVVFQHARTRLAYGERLRRAQRRRDARVQLRAAAEIFDQLDARPWAERARTELRASGETLTGGDGGEQLTAQELQIALLVTEGQTNAEVGRALFLSTRTVEFHLSRAYRKLGVSSRTELTRRFVRAGTPPG
jgi:class 3 adenylate cyclase/DNA-binding CsgD family transcriptional regulator/lipopolysaccharide biosynthesis regulator YciM